MDYSDNYGRAFGDFSESRLRQRLFPNDLIEGWSGLIEQIIDGYGFIHPELDNDLAGTRGLIEPFLVDDDNLNAFPEHAGFKDIIAKLDQQYLEMTQQHPKWEHLHTKWWAKRILKFARKNYVDFLRIHGVQEEGLTVKVVE